MKNILYLVPFLFSCHSSLNAEALLLSTWNMEWLGLNTPKSKRHSKDINKLADYFQQLKTDILAFQEVNSLEAISAITGNNYQIFISDRSQNRYKRQQFKEQNQYTGFAVKKGIHVKKMADFALSKTNRMRFASYIIINDQTKNPLHILSVHLKAGCYRQVDQSKSCLILEEEFEGLFQWINQRQHQKEQFIILGDFNHQLANKRSPFSHKIANKKDIQLLTDQLKPNCFIKSKKGKGIYQHKNLIDHIIVSKEFRAHPPKMLYFAKRDVEAFNLSDHCPISIAIDL